MFEIAVADHPKCRFVVATRPRAYEGLTVLAGFEEAQVEPFEQEAVDAFLRHWSKGLFSEDAEAAEQHRKELADALKAKPEIRRMARNPVMLTAMAALYRNDKQLPDDRAELYESILRWLLLSRKLVPGRVSEKVARRRLSRIALEMQTHSKGRQTQVRRRWAAKVIADEFEGDADTAEEFAQRVLAILTSEEFRDLCPWQIVPKLADRGRYVASEATMYRVLHEEALQNHREPTREAQKRHRPDELVATAPNQAWSWDITHLKGPYRGMSYQLYLALDVFSRMVECASLKWPHLEP